MRLAILALAACVALGPFLHSHGADNSPEAVEQAVEAIRGKHHLPALAAAVMLDGRMTALAAVGVRKEGSPVKVTVDDSWQIGSDTKSMTATIAAMLIEQGRLRWDTKVGEALPNLREAMAPAWREATLEQLLTHRSGAPAVAPPDLWAAAWKRIGSPTEQRLAFVRGLLSRPPVSPPGTAYAYSNQGYTIAGAMLESVTGTSWENLMRTTLFEPLGMASAGFGAPGTPGKIDQPWGHQGQGSSRLPVEPGPDADNPPSIAPAGGVHCSLTDLAKYVAMHVQGERVGASILKPASFLKLHTPPDGASYACGWGVATRGWAGGRALSHTGSNTMFLVVMWAVPAKNTVLLAATNAAGPEAQAAADEAVGELIRRFLAKDQ